MRHAARIAASRDGARRAAGLLALGLMMAAAEENPLRGEEPAGVDWTGKRVVQKYNNFPLRKDHEAVLESGSEIHIYRVGRVEDGKLWLTAEDENLSGWAAPGQF